MIETLPETSPTPETSHRTFQGETFQEVIMAEIPQGKTPDCTPETSQETEIHQGKAPEHTLETSQGTGTTMKELMTQEGTEDMMIGVVMPAMGVDAETAARRP